MSKNNTQEKIKKMADGRKLPYLKKESQDICFLTGGHNDYLKKNIKLKKGKIITVDGKIIGEHQGLPLYTIGQRHGFSKGGGIPYYVVSKVIVYRKRTDDYLCRRCGEIFPKK